MDSSTSDFTFSPDSDIGLTTGNYNLHSQRISPVAIFLIIILLIMLIGFFINNLSVNNFEPNLENYKSSSKPETKPEIKHEIKHETKSLDTNHPILIKKSLDLTNQELNNSINKLTTLINQTGEEITHNSNQEIKELERKIDDLKSEMIILQSKLIDHEMQKSTPEAKPENKPEAKPKVIPRPNINITTDNMNPPVSYTYNNFQDDVIIYDPIANYDRLKLTDPLVDPRGRSSADQIPTPQVAAQLNFPTQGVIDRYHRVGLLIALTNDEDKSRYYNGANRFDDFYGNQNKRRPNILESNADYSMGSYNTYGTDNASSSTPTYLADTSNPKYNGVEIVQNSPTSSSTSTSSSKSGTPKPKVKKHKHKRKPQRENFGIEGFETESNYEMFESSGDIDYNTNMYANPVYDSDSDSDSDDNITNMKYPKRNPYFNDYDIGEGEVEGFGNLGSKRDNANNHTVNVNNGDNGILELIGKKITDNWYKYFTSISVGNKVIKINVHNKNRRELYDGDIVFIQELGKRYRVKIDEMDMIEYNPYFF